MAFLFKKSSSAPTEAPKPQVILVIETKSNWTKIFEGFKDKNGLPFRVEQADWEDIALTAYPNNSAFLDIQPSRRPLPNTTMDKFRTIRPDIVLIRASVMTINYNQKNILYGFKFAGIPAVNSLESVYNFLERPWVFAELIKIRNKLGEERFPLIEQNYYSNYREMLITPQYPIVLKVGHAHAGYGKVKVMNHHDFEDMRSLVALHKDYSTAEPYVEGEYDLRIQKIGNHYRAFKRISASGNWKTNTGTSLLEKIPVTDQYKLWADECSKMFGGLDILAVDAIHAANGKEYILEVNDTAIGLGPEDEEEDNGYIRDLVIEKLRSL
eukprot:Phypoly_transcript_09696.p1 GENE.Phypoly_transcript_09696~~Phypoly_transcript_09696.p1  ORF type:complete len:325 (+),score=46.13 Phypoly_transcript_09696:161-1135(+)